MDQSLKVTDIKSEPTESISSDLMTNLNEMQRENVSLVQSEIYIKTEPQEDKNEFLIIPSTSYEMCSKDNITDEPMIKIERKDFLDELMQDPLDIGDEINVKISTSNSDNEISYKPGPSEQEVEEYIFTNDKKSHKSDTSNKKQPHEKVYKNKKHICPICNKTLRRKNDLDTHLLIHSGTKPFTCKICKKSFTQKGNMESHMLIHSGEKPYVCGVCKKVFRHKTSLNNHQSIHSGKQPFSCQECNKSFTRKDTFIEHIRVHTGDKPFACDLCNKEFRHKSALNRHRREVCNKSFVE